MCMYTYAKKHISFLHKYLYLFILYVSGYLYILADVDENVVLGVPF